MYSGQFVFTPMIDFMPMKTFQRCVAGHRGNFSVKQFTCMDQFRAIAFAQLLSYRESLQDTEACLRAQNKKLYHMGIRGKVARSTFFFVIRAKANLKCRRRYSHTVDRSTGIVCDQTILLTVSKSAVDYPDKQQRVKYYDAGTDKHPVFLNNNFLLRHHHCSALQKATASGTVLQVAQAESAYQALLQDFAECQTRIWITVSVYLIVAIIKKRLNLQESLYT